VLKRKIQPRPAQLHVEVCRRFGRPLLEQREKGRTPSVVLVSIFKAGMFHVEHFVDIIKYVHMVPGCHWLRNATGYAFFMQRGRRRFREFVPCHCAVSLMSQFLRYSIH